MKKILLFSISLLVWSGSISLRANGILLERTQQHFESLQEALRRAENGDTLLLESGTYLGNFIIDKTLTIKSIDTKHPAVLDGGNVGTVVTIRSDNVTLQNLQILHSGMAPRYKKSERWEDLWGDSGIIVYAHSHIRLKRLFVAACDDGITVLGSRNFEISDSVIKNNHLSGIDIQGGQQGKVERNHIEKNEYGIDIDQWCHRKRIWRSESSNNDEEGKAVKSSYIEIIGNQIISNGSTGIHLYNANNILIEKNRVLYTGVVRKPNYKDAIEWYRWFSVQTGNAEWSNINSPNAQPMIRMAGTGISLTCESHDNTIKRNLISGNFSYGIDIDLSHKTKIFENRIIGNHDGIYLTNGSRNNRINSNVVEKNLQCGIGISCYDKYLLRPYDNLIFSNDIKENPFNAYDIASRELSREEILIYLRKWREWLSDEEKEKTLANPYRLQKVIEQIKEYLFKPGYNHWDEGSHGNHYSNFDEVAEGFVDRNGDGIGERPYPIPGGKSVDHFPLSSSSVATLETEVPARNAQP